MYNMLSLFLITLNKTMFCKTIPQFFLWKPYHYIKLQYYYNSIVTYTFMSILQKLLSKMCVCVCAHARACMHTHACMMFIM